MKLFPARPAFPASPAAPTARRSGFSLIELSIAVGITMLVTAAVFAIAHPAHGSFLREPELADLQQRLRVVVDRLEKDLAAAGAGAYAGLASAPLTDITTALFPYRAGASDADPPGIYRGNTITIFSVPRGQTEPSSVTYSLKTDAASGTYQVIAYDGGAGQDAPVADDIVGLAFEYYGDPQPPRMRKPLSDPTGPWTTYGPKPSAAAVAPFVAGENCVFVSDGSPTPQPRLPVLGLASTLVRLSIEQLTDGPWCPDEASPVRWDADLLRVRRIAVSVRAQAASSSLRGPAGVLFTHGGTSRGGHTWLPDVEIHFDVSPPNLNRSR